MVLQSHCHIINHQIILPSHVGFLRASEYERRVIQSLLVSVGQSALC